MIWKDCEGVFANWIFRSIEEFDLKFRNEKKRWLFSLFLLSPSLYFSLILSSSTFSLSLSLSLNKKIIKEWVCCCSGNLFSLRLSTSSSFLFHSRTLLLLWSSVVNNFISQNTFTGKLKHYSIIVRVLAISFFYFRKFKKS